MSGGRHVVVGTGAVGLATLRFVHAQPVDTGPERRALALAAAVRAARDLGAALGSAHPVAAPTA